MYYYIYVFEVKFHKLSTVIFFLLLASRALSCLWWFSPACFHGAFAIFLALSVKPAHIWQGPPFCGLCNFFASLHCLKHGRGASWQIWNNIHTKISGFKNLSQQEQSRAWHMSSVRILTKSEFNMAARVTILDEKQHRSSKGTFISKRPTTMKSFR